MSDHETTPTHHPHPPRPPYEPTPPAHRSAATPHPEPLRGAAEGPRPTHGPGEHRGRPRTRRLVGLSAAVAIVAGAIGGGTATLVSGAYGEAAPSAGSAALGANVSTADLDVSDVVDAVGPSVVEIDAVSGTGSATGSGVVISEDGEILTNNHVVSGASRVEVTFADGDTATAEVVGAEPDLDMALLDVDGVADLDPAELGDSDAVGVGDRVVAFGSPQGLSGTVTSGIVSAKGREVTVEREREEDARPRGDGAWPFEFGGGRYNGELGPETTTYEAIQTDASLNPGNSGGPLVAMDGSVIGINSAIHDNSSAGGEAGSIGLGFAVPVDDVKEILDELRAGGER